MHACAQVLPAYGQLSCKPFLGNENVYATERHDVDCTTWIAKKHHLGSTGELCAYVDSYFGDFLDLPITAYGAAANAQEQIWHAHVLQEK